MGEVIRGAIGGLFVVAIFSLFWVPLPSQSIETDPRPLILIQVTPLPDLIHLDQDLEEQADCLAVNAYHEARGEGPEGVKAVMFVTRNRVLHRDFPDTYCDVVYQGERVNGHYVSCQFSWLCDGVEVGLHEQEVLREIRQKAIKFVTTPHRIFPEDPTGGSTHYHRSDHDVWWSDHPRMIRTVSIGAHEFYGHREWSL